MKRILIPILLCALTLATAVGADPTRYRLDMAQSSVQFSYVLNGVAANGTMPIQAADLVLDFDQAANSSANVTLNADGTRTGVIFVTSALKSPEVLDTDAHPEIRFVSRSFTAMSGGARVTGDVTIRGVTRPLTLNARIFRQQGTQEGDRSRLSVVLTGSIDRRDFGADGYLSYVAPTVRLRITARLNQTG